MAIASRARSTRVGWLSSSGVGSNVTVGVYVIKGDSVTWISAFNLNRVIMGGQIVAVVALIVLRPLFKAKAQATEAARAEMDT